MVVDSGPTMIESAVKPFVPYIGSESYEHMCKNEAMNLVLDATNLLRIRQKVCELYENKKVIIAPCLSKLYISREQQVIDSDGKMSPDWFYFGTGVLAIIYDRGSKTLKIVLFEENSLRLLWCMKWAEYVTVQTQTSNFHILNTKPDHSQHVGFLYENKDVADVMLNAITFITEGLEEETDASSCGCQEQQKNSTKNKLLRTLSANSKKLKATKSFDDEGKSNEFPSKFSKRRSSLRDSLLRKAMGKKCESPLLDRKFGQKERSATVIGTCSITDVSNNIITKLDKTPDEKALNENQTKKLTALTRASSFRNVKNSSLQNDTTIRQQDSVSTNCKGNDGNSKVVENRISNRDSVMRTLFRKRRISRSQSLKIINRKRDSQLSQILQTEASEEKAVLIPDAKHYQRATKLTKPRSSTDSLLLRGEAMKCIIETGHVARYARQRKQWAKTLQKEILPSTDLCVTEL